MYWNESTSIVPIINEETHSHHSCRDTVSTWLLAHFCFTWCITFVFITAPACTLFTVGQFVVILNQHRSANFQLGFALTSERHLRFIDIRRQVIEFIRNEIQLIFFYVSTAFLCKVLTDSSPIRSMTLTCWLIEAAFLPGTISLTVLGLYLDANTRFSDLLRDTDPKSKAILAYLIKVPLFVVMRYAEMYSSAEINDYKTIFFYLLCNTPGLHHIPDKHRLRPYLGHVQSSVS
jgi:hypothetical protein